MLALLGYKNTQEIASGVRTAIFRGYNEKEGSSVIIKILKSEYPTVEEITRLKQEYKITHNLECQGIVKAVNQLNPKIALIEYFNNLFTFFVKPTIL